MKQLADIGLVGLADMGENLALNVESRGFTIAVCNRTTQKADDFVTGPRTEEEHHLGAHDRRLCRFVKIAKENYADGESRKAGGRIHQHASAAP